MGHALRKYKILVNCINITDWNSEKEVRKSMKKYELDDLKHFKAPYLERGFREEIFELKEFYYDENNSESLAKFEVIKSFQTPNEPEFYLDSLAAIRLFYQAVVTTQSVLSKKCKGNGLFHFSHEVRPSTANASFRKRTLISDANSSAKRI
jgi:hypothetical protein